MSTRPQRLRLGSLAPRDFERLCHRLARLQGAVEDVRIFGVPGQAQDGIDLYARRHDGTYAVIQCKRSSDAFTPGEITEAVDKFLAGEWAATAKEFVLAVTADLEPTGTARRIQEEQERLAKKGIGFKPWDEAELSALLKDEPRLVDDFFGRETVRVFLGEKVAQSLEGRLDAGDVIEYRRVMGELYKEVFGRLERGVYSDAHHLPLDSRFVMPDVVVSDAAWPAFASLTPPAVQKASVPPPSSWSNRYSPDIPAALERIPGSPTQTAPAVGNRVAVADWLNSGTWHLVMGHPGAGKSALLRTLVLDTLTDSPRELGRLERFDAVLPVWLPFAYWTGAAKQQSTAPSVLQAVRAWLDAYDHGHLWPLIEKALGDERLLLVVDGLDEWATPDRARQCLERLEIFASTKKANVVASSRPFSTADLPLDQQRWRIARLAPLNQDQQLTFITLWLAPVNEHPDQQANEWASEIRSLPHLRELADLPLFLALLLRSREQRAEFPEDLYAVLNEAVERMIGDHRRRKIDTSQISDQFPRASDIRKVSASAAEHMQEQSVISISDDELRSTFRSTLADSIGYPPDQAHAMAQGLVDALSPGVGLMVRPAPDETQFFHRSVLEFLAAERMLTLDHEALIALICDHVTDRRWALVIRFLLRGLIRPQEIKAVFDSLDEAGKDDPLLREAASLLAADVAVGAGATDAPTRRQLLDRVSREIEFGDRLSHRLQLLSRLVPGLSRPETRDDLMVRFSTWLQACALTTTASALEAVAEWPADEETLDLLWHALHRDDSRAQRMAAGLLGTKFATDDTVAQRLVGLAESTLCYDRRAAAIEALSTGWPHHPGLEALIASGIAHPDYAVRRASVAADLHRGDSDTDHRAALIELLRSAPRHSAWSEGVMELMFDSYPDDQTIFDAFEPDADPAQHERFRYGYSEAPSTLVILKGYAHCPEARQYLLYLLSAERPDADTHGLLTDYLPWNQLAQAFRSDGEVVSAVEAFIRAQASPSLRDLYFFSLIARTDWVRDQIIARLDNFGAGWAIRALLDGWPHDPVARQALNDLVTSETVPDPAIGYLPDIVADPVKALDLLAAVAPKASNQAAVIEALGPLNQQLNAPDSRVADLLAQALTQGQRTWLSDPEASAFVHFPTDQQVRQRALDRLDQPEAPLWAIGYGFRDDAEMRQLLAARRPLNAPLRARLVEELGELPAGDDTVTTILALYRTETDSTVRLLAAAAYARRLHEAGAIPEQAIEEFTQEILATGMDHEGRRAAGFCALAELGQLHQLTNLKDANGKPVVIQHPIANRQVFFGFVCKHWNAIKDAFGSDHLNRLSPYSPAGTELIAEILAVAHDYPETYPDLAGLLDQYPQTRTSAAGLSYLSRTKAPVETLRDAVFSALQTGSTAAIGGFYPVWMTLHVLVEDLASDPEVTTWLDDVLAELQAYTSRGPGALPWLPIGTAAAIARLRPDHHLVTELVSAHKRPDEGPWHAFPQWSELGAAAAKTAQEIIEHARAVTRIVLLNDLPAEVIHQALTARLRQTPSLATDLGSLLPQLDGADRGTVIRLLERSGHIDRKLDAWLREIARNGAHPADATFDPLTAQTRNIVMLARDILDASLDLTGILP
ncbi:NACHT domain-containing protein [Kitasatospora sp. NPDC051705]|uniref:NACHT domain-containing protein n=1 Tax=Kitasatospora sp. NPDC051705 TaxID=3364057 RepID=UPI0037B0412B